MKNCKNDTKCSSIKALLLNDIILREIKNRSNNSNDYI